MEKDEKQVWSTDDIRSHRSEWSLAADAALLEHIQSLSQNVLSRTHAVLQSVESLGNDLNVTATKISNTSDKFLFLANTQFVENRVYDDEEATPCEDPTLEQPHSYKDERELSSILEDAFTSGIAVVDSKFSEFQLPGSDSEDEDASSPSRLVLRPHNPYSCRLLPHLIGSSEFFNDDKVGLNSALCSSESSSSLSLNEEDNSPEFKPYLQNDSSSAGSVESIGSMEASKSASPIENASRGFNDSINPSGKLKQALEQKFSSQYNHSDIMNQHTKPKDEPLRNDSGFQEASKSSNVDPFSHHMNPASNLFAPPPFVGGESSEESDNESLFGFRKQKRNGLFIDQDDDEDDDVAVQESTAERPKFENQEKEATLPKGTQEEGNRVTLPTVKDQVLQKKLPAGAVSIFGKHVNPFAQSGPPLFPGSEESDQDESEPTHAESSEDGFSNSLRSSSDLSSSKHDVPISKNVAKKSLFDDDEDDGSTKDFDSLLFQSSLFPPTNKKLASHSNSNTVDKSRNLSGNLFSNNTEDIFSSIDNSSKSGSFNKPPDIFASPKKPTSGSLFDDEEEFKSSLISKSSVSNGAMTGGFKSTEEGNKKLGEEKSIFENSASKLKTSNKPPSEALFDNNSEDELFPPSNNKVSSLTRNENTHQSKKTLFSDTDTVDFFKSASPLAAENKKLAVSKNKPFLDLFDSTEDDDSFLFGSNFSKVAEDSSSKKQVEPSKKQVSILGNAEMEDNHKSPALDSLFSETSKTTTEDKDDIFKIGKASVSTVFEETGESDPLKHLTLESQNIITTSNKRGSVFSSYSSSSDDVKSNLTSSFEEIIDPVANKVGAVKSEGKIFNLSNNNNSKSTDSENEVEDITPDTNVGTYDEASVSGKASSNFTSIEDHSASDINSKPPEPPVKPVSRSATSEIDKLKMKFTSSGSDDVSSDDSVANLKPKLPNPGKLASSRGQNIIVAALMPGSKYRKAEKDESSTASSESTPTFPENSSHLPLELGSETSEPVSKSTSLENSSIVGVAKQAETTDLDESSSYSHFLANDAMKRRARIGSKRRPPSQKVRQEAAQASLNTESFVNFNNETITPTPTVLESGNTFPEESQTKSSSEPCKTRISTQNPYRDTIETRTADRTSASSSPPNPLSHHVDPNNLFTPDTPEKLKSQDIRESAKKSSLFESGGSENLLTSSLKGGPMDSKISESMSSIFDEDTDVPRIKSIDLFNESNAEKVSAENLLKDPFDKTKSSLITPSRSSKENILTDENSPVSLIFSDDTTNTESNSLFNDPIRVQSAEIIPTSYPVSNKVVSSDASEKILQKESNSVKDFSVSSLSSKNQINPIDLFGEESEQSEKFSPVSDASKNTKSFSVQSENASKEEKTPIKEFLETSSRSNLALPNPVEPEDFLNDNRPNHPSGIVPAVSVTQTGRNNASSSSPISEEESFKNLVGNDLKFSPGSEVSDLTEKKIKSSKTDSSETKSNKSSLGISNPLCDDLSDEDLFGSYNPKPITSVLNKFNLNSNLNSDNKSNSSQESNNYPTKSAVESGSKEDDIFSETDRNIEKLFPKVKIKAKTSLHGHPLSEVSDDDDENLFEDANTTMEEREEKQNLNVSSATHNGKPDSSLPQSSDNSSLFDESFKTVPSVFSNQDTSTTDDFTEIDDSRSDYLSGKHVSGRNVSEENTQPAKPIESKRSSIFDDDESVNFSADSEKTKPDLFGSETEDDLFQHTSQSQPKNRNMSPSSALSHAKSSKPLPDLFGKGDEEDDELFKSTPKSSSNRSNSSQGSATSSTSISKTGFGSKSNLSNHNSPNVSDLASSSVSAKGIKNTSKKQETIKPRGRTLFLDDDEDNDDDDLEDGDLFSVAPEKSNENKTAVPPKKTFTPLPKLNTSIFGDDDDSDTELFAASLKKK